MARVVRFIDQDPSITDVILTGRFAAAVSGINFGGETPKGFYTLTFVANPDLKDRIKIFEIGLSNIISSLTEGGKKVTILLDLPELNFDPRSCLRFRGNIECSISRDVVEDRQRSYTQIVSALQNAYHYRVVDLKDALCTKERCYAKAGDHILYLDQHHLGINGNAFLINSSFPIL